MGMKQRNHCHVTSKLRGLATDPKKFVHTKEVSFTDTNLFYNFYGFD